MDRADAAGRIYPFHQQPEGNGMTYSALIRHWMGTPPEQITSEWTADPATLPDLLAKQQSRLVMSVETAMKQQANAGNVAAVKWIESRSSVGSTSRGTPDLSQQSFKTLQETIMAAIDGDVEAAEWLQSKGLLDMSLGKERNLGSF